MLRGGTGRDQLGGAVWKTDWKSSPLCPQEEAAVVLGELMGCLFVP
jgi:hypothetical protein